MTSKIEEIRMKKGQKMICFAVQLDNLPGDLGN